MTRTRREEAKAVGSRRAHGTGSLLTRRTRAGAEVWYGKFRENGRQVKRRLGVRRHPDGHHGLSQLDAESRLARMMGREPRTGGRSDLATAYGELRRALQTLDRAVAVVNKRQRPLVRDALEAMYVAEDAVVQAEALR